ncbi:MAG: hypothetical protein ACRD9W_27810, partial [Terriglobia bacterium]
MTKKVLAIGIDPSFVDYTAMPQFTPEIFTGRRSSGPEFEISKVFLPTHVDPAAAHSSSQMSERVCGSKRPLLAATG